MNLPPLYQVWIGPPRHWFYDLCMETVRKHNPDVFLVTDPREILGDVPKEILDEQFSPVHRCDWIRKMLLWKTGGAYIDADFICWHPLDTIRFLGNWWDAVLYREWNGGLADGICSGRKGSPFWEEAARRAISWIQKSYPQEPPWLACGTWSLNETMQIHRWQRILELPTHLIQPVSIMDANWFAATMDSPPRNVCLGWMVSKHVMSNFLDTFPSANAFLKSSSRLAWLIREGLGIN